MIRLTRLRAVVLFLVGGCCFALTGCSNPARERIIGKWEATFEMTEEDMAEMTPTDNPIVAGIGKLLMKSMRAKMAWEFAADDTLTTSTSLLGNSDTRSGLWRFVSGDENSTTIKVEFENEDPHELRFTFSDPNTIEAVPYSNGKWMWNRIVKFKRVVPTP